MTSPYFHVQVPAPTVSVRCVACHERHDAPTYEAAAAWLGSHPCTPRSFT